MPTLARRRGLLARLKTGVRAFLLSEEPPEWFWRTPGVSPPTNSGVAVTDQTALRVTAVLSCVKVLAESISTLPLMVFERQRNGDKRPAPDHPVSEILHTLANEESTAQSVRETLSAHVLLRGNAYARIVRDGGGDVRELWPIAPGSIQPDRPRPGGKTWPAARAEPDAVRVDFTCGYGGAAAVPHAIRRAVLLIVGTLYANRETVAPVAMQPVPHAAEWLLAPYRVLRFAG